VGICYGYDTMQCTTSFVVYHGYAVKDALMLKSWITYITINGDGHPVPWLYNTRGSDTNCKLQGILHGGAMTIHARYHVLIMAQMFRVFVFSSCGLPCILLCSIYQHPKDDFLLPRYILATTTEDSDRISARQR
jgi:hypothetical protein